ncbi:cytochrome c biogenesis protein DipZ [Chitinimonas sp.]|uniref:cytochrome c biogenesis protein DipZ n=1 Tax=Chitinimonas sp. TaxID=1934313 RepID=UPI002F955F74
MIAPLVFLGGALTILSPCVLPVLPFVFTRADRPFLRNGLPMLAGMALTFAGIATLAAVGGAWAVQLNQFGRGLALLTLALFALTLLSRRLADAMARPFLALGNRLMGAEAASGEEGGVGRSLLLGVATGLLWAPCAGPILGLILTGAALSGPNAQTAFLLLVYAAGAATSLAIALLAGGRVFTLLKRGLGAGEWVRRGLGVLVLVAVAVIGLGWDSSVLTNLSLAGTNRLEQSLLDRFGSQQAAAGPAVGGAMMASNSMMMRKAGSASLPVEGELPSLAGATGWLNTPPLTTEGLRGKVVLVDFWTYSCINCLRSLPYVNGWYQKYKDHGLVVLGVHAPEFAFEKNPGNVRKAVAEQGIAYPVALDNDYAIWRGFNNQYWPAHYFVDAAGHIRGHHFGEGDYLGSEQTLRQLLIEAGAKDLPPLTGDAPKASGVQAAANEAQVQSPETYVGYERAEQFSSPEGFKPDAATGYTLPKQLGLNQWGLTGQWQVGAERAVLAQAHGGIQYRFQARDLHLVLGPGQAGHPVRFRVLIDGAPPKADHGADVDADGYGKVSEQRLYQLVRQSGEVSAHTFSIEFLDAGAEAYAFTFG